MKYLMDLLYNLILVEYHFEKSKKIITISITCIRFMPTIIQGIIIFMNEFDYTTTL